MKIEFYKDEDYDKLIELYKTSTQFSIDKVTDSKESLSRKIERDPGSILLVKDEDSIIGSVSIIEDGRMALLFRLAVSPDVPDKEMILKFLLSRSEEILKDRGYKEVHNTAPSGHKVALSERGDLGFKKGAEYSWFWKTID